MIQNNLALCPSRKRNLNSNEQMESRVPNIERIPMMEKADTVFINVLTIILHQTKQIISKKQRDRLPKQRNKSYKYK